MVIIRREIIASRHTYTPRVSLLVQRMRRGARRRWRRAFVKRVLRWQSRSRRHSFQRRHRMTLSILRSIDDTVICILIDALLQIAIRINRTALRTDEMSILISVRPRLLIVGVPSAEQVFIGHRMVTANDRRLILRLGHHRTVLTTSRYWIPVRILSVLAVLRAIVLSILSIRVIVRRVLSRDVAGIRAQTRRGAERRSRRANVHQGIRGLLRGRRGHSSAHVVHRRWWSMLIQHRPAS